MNPPVLRPRTSLLLTLLGTGLLLAATPPRAAWPLGLLGLALVLGSLRQRKPYEAALLGWLAGFLLNLGGHWWGPAVAERFAGVGGLGAAAIGLGLSGYQGLVFSLGAGAAALLTRHAHLSWRSALPLSLALAETLVPTVFPWNCGIFVWRAWPLLQVAEIGGPPAVTALIAFLAVLLSELLEAAARRQQLPPGFSRGVVIAVAIVGLGAARAWHVAHLRNSAPRLTVAVVQPNVGLLSQTARKQRGDALLARLRDATDRALTQGAELVVWPESVFPFLFDAELDREFAPGHPWQLRTLRRGRLLVGALTHRFGSAVVQNSAVLIAQDGKIRGHYAKTDLVPFGEYIPLAERFPAWAQRIAKRLPQGPVIAPGDGPVVLDDQGLRIGPLVCAEELVTEHVLDTARPGIQLLVTLANHAWFGDSAAADEALALATLASIETRRDLVRATATGRSSFGDALGRISAQGSAPLAPGDEATPELLIKQVALLDTPALGPTTIALFPYAVALALVLLALWAHRRVRVTSTRKPLDPSRPAP